MSSQNLPDATLLSVSHACSPFGWHMLIGIGIPGSMAGSCMAILEMAAPVIGRGGAPPQLNLTSPGVAPIPPWHCQFPLPANRRIVLLLTPCPSAESHCGHAQHP